MAEIKCPHCGTVFTVDESDYATIVRQVRDAEFHREVEARERAAREAGEKDATLARERAEHEAAASRLALEAEITQLKAQIDSLAKAAEAERELAVAQATADVARERDALSAQIDAERLTSKQQIEALSLQVRAEQEAARERLAAEQATAKERLAAEQASAKERLAAEKAAADARLAAERATARERLERVQAEAEAREARARSEQEQQASELRAKMNEEMAAKDALIKYREEEIAQLRDMRSRLSTKLVGESLEQHCQSEFNKIRAVAFPGAYFEKDNDASEGTKGDFIYREEAADGVELLSIMFEMKTEEETSAARNRKTNEHFLAKLDADRTKKGCEYAVLVSMLEPESELYNQGIVDMSWRYPKMYVIRPQFFIPLISLLRNAALSAAKARQELAEIRQQNVDVTNFEEALGKFQADFGRNWASAQKNYDAAIDEIDKSIRNLEKVKKSLETSRNQFRLADDKVERLTIRRLTRKNPTMKALIDEAREARERAEADASGEPVEPDDVE